MADSISVWLAKNTAREGLSSDSEPVYPFRHVEYRLLCFQIFAGAAAIVFGPRYILTTLGGISFVVICLFVSSVIAFFVWRYMLVRYDKVMRYIVQGSKRMLHFSAGVSIFGTLLFATAGIMANRHTPVGTIRYVDAEVSKVGKMYGPKLYGWNATFHISGDSYYQLVSAKDVPILQSNRSLVLGLQKGMLGYDYIVSINAKDLHNSTINPDSFAAGYLQR